MKPNSSLFAAGVLALALSAPGVSYAANTVLNEGFDDVNALEGWSQYNISFPQGQGWFQGNSDAFAAQAGAADSYVATNFLAALDGSGSVDSWLISPLLNLNGTTVLSFFSRSAATPGYSDKLEVSFDNGTGSYALLTTVGGVNAYPASWTEFSTTLYAQGSGRFAFRYLGDAAALDYIGIDSVSVLTAVPEPSSWLMLVLGVTGLCALRRKLS